MQPLTDSKQCEDYLRNIWKYNKLGYHERVYVVFLDKEGKRISHKLLCKGRYAECIIDPRKIVKRALKLQSNHVVLAHNHPCGSKMPSEQDLLITKEIDNILFSLQINLLDHIILTENEYYSFKDEGLIERTKKAG